MRHPFPANVWARGTGVALALLAAGGCLVTGRASAQGTIVHIVPPQPIAYSDALGSVSIDINGDGVDDFTVSGGQDIDLNPHNDNAIIAVPEPPGDLGALIYAFDQGATISSSLAPVMAWWGADGNAPPTIVSATDIGSIGYFQGNTDGYAGIRLDVAGSLYYGWIHIHNFTINWGQISDWAYETRPDTQILAGAVPEPSTSTLLILFGAALWLARKRS